MAKETMRVSDAQRYWTLRLLAWCFICLGAHGQALAQTTPDAAFATLVEGARKAIARYNKLMLRRMNWKLRPEPRADAEAEEEEDTGVAAEEDAEAKAAKEEAEEALFRRGRIAAGGGGCGGQVGGK